MKQHGHNATDALMTDIVSLLVLPLCLLYSLCATFVPSLKLASFCSFVRSLARSLVRRSFLIYALFHAVFSCRVNSLWFRSYGVNFSLARYILLYLRILYSCVCIYIYI